MKRVARELEMIAKELMAVPMMIIEPDTQTVRWARESLMTTLGVDRTWKMTYSKFMTIQNGRNNKFHFFGVWTNRSGESRGGNSYGRIGYNPRAIEVARGSSASSVISSVSSKANAKIRKGYSVVEV